MVTEEITISGMHCDACEKTITRALGKEGIKVESISYKDGKATISGTDIPRKRVDALLRPKGYAIVDETVKATVKKRQTYELERNVLTNGFLSLAILLLIQAALVLFVFKRFPHYTSAYLMPLMYVPLVVVTNMVALWHQRAYNRDVSCMTGMMIGMTIGMTTGFTIGGIVGLTNGMFVGSLVGTGVGIVAGVYAGKCCGTMGIMEGMMAGLMSGTMGAMLTVMLVNDHANIFLPILIAITIAILAGMMRISIEEHAGATENLRPWPATQVFLLSLLVTILISVIIMLAPKSIYL